MNGQAKFDRLFCSGPEAKVAFKQQADGLRIELPAEGSGKYAYAFRIVFDGAVP